MSGIWNLSTLCRCCHADGVFKSLSSTYKVNDNVEIYIEMLKNTLGLYLQSSGVEVSYTICDTCITQLRQASQFKEQVLQCEEKFIEYCNNELLQQVEVKVEKDEDVEVAVKQEIIKTEDDNIIGDCENFNIDIEKDVDIIVEREKNDVKTVEETEKAEMSIEKDPTNNTSSKRDLKWCNRIETENGFKYSCKKCSENFHNYRHLIRHINKKHMKSFHCKTCDETFTELKKYNNHYKNHKKKVYKCKFCEKTYTSLPSFYYHTNTHVKKNKFICDICNKVFLHRNSIKRHMQWHMGFKKKIICDICGHTFNDITNLNKHKWAVHDKIKSHKCNLCPKSFALPQNLKYHIRRHVNDRPFKCDVCEKAFITITILNKHKKTHEMKENGGSKEYKCKICLNIFDHKGLYLSHVRKHDVIKPFNCKICGKGFCTQYTMNRHIETHEGSKKFKCDQCDVSLSTKSLLKRHSLRIHDPNRPIKMRFSCDICKMMVTDIEKHKKSHLNKRFQCEFCPRSYSERNAMHRHVKQTHSGVNFPCNVCGKIYVKKGSLKSHVERAHKNDVKVEEE